MIRIRGAKACALPTMVACVPSIVTTNAGDRDERVRAPVDGSVRRGASARRHARSHLSDSPGRAAKPPGKLPGSPETPSHCRH